MSDKLVTVITRTKNRQLFVPRVFETIVQQSYRPIQWIIVNDNGDNVDMLIETLKSRYQEQLDGIDVSIVNKEKSTGMEGASNTGIEHARGFYIKLLDDDDTLHPLCIEKQVYYMEYEKLESERGVVCYTQKVFERIEDNTIVLVDSAPMKLKPKNIAITELAITNQFTVHSFLYQRDVFNRIGLYNESLPVLGDWEFNLRFIMAYDIGIVPECLVNYHIREDSEGANANSEITKHHRYYAVIRNHFIRDENVHPSLLALMVNASTVFTLDNRLNGISKLLQTKDNSIFDRIIDAAIAVEKENLKVAYDLMEIAHEVKPNTQFIKNKLDEYQFILGRD
jgi:glycosyltransferase involved in cell wall biosynthesis